MASLQPRLDFSSSSFTPINVDSKGHRLPSPTFEAESGRPDKRQKASKPNPWTPRKPKKATSQRRSSKATETSRNHAFDEHEDNVIGDETDARDRAHRENEQSPSETAMSRLRAFLCQPDRDEAREPAIRAEEPAINTRISHDEDTLQVQPAPYRHLLKSIEESHGTESADHGSISAEEWPDHHAAAGFENPASPGTSAKVLVPATQDETIVETPTMTSAALHITSPEVETYDEPWDEAMDLEWECVDELVGLERTYLDDPAPSDDGTATGVEMDRSGCVDETETARFDRYASPVTSAAGPIRWLNPPCPHMYHDVVVPEPSPCPSPRILPAATATGSEAQDDSYFDELDEQDVFDLIDASTRVSAWIEQTSSSHAAAGAEMSKLHFNAPRDFSNLRHESQRKLTQKRNKTEDQSDPTSSPRICSHAREPTTKQSSSRTVATSPLKAESLEPIAVDTPSSPSCASKSPLLTPFVRGNFPQPVADRSSIPGLSSSLSLRVCFRVGELLTCAKSAAYQNRPILVELYAQVKERQDGLGELHLVLGDLFHPQRPPYLEAFWRGWQSNEYWVTDAKCLTIGAICRVLGKVEKELLGGKWILTIFSAQQVCWTDVDHVKGIVCAK